MKRLFSTLLKGLGTLAKNQLAKEERVWFFFNVYVVISIKIVCVRACLRDRETQTDRNIEKGDRKIESDVGVIT